LIGNIDKLLVVDDFFIIMDKYITHSLFVFNKLTQEKIQIQKQGSGPGDYVVLQDIYWDSKQQVVKIYCNVRKKILHYDIQGHFLREETLPYRSNRVFSIGNHYTYYVDYLRNPTIIKNNKYPNLMLTTQDGKVLCGADYFSADISTSLVYSTLPQFSVMNDTMLAIKPDHSQTVYYVTKDNIIPAHYLNFNNHNVDHRYWNKVTETGMTFKKITDYSNAIGLCESYYYMENKDVIIFKYRYREQLHTVLYSKKSHKLLDANPFYNDMDQITPFQPVLVQGNKVYCLLQAEDIITASSFLYEQQSVPESLLNTTQALDNPIIVVFTLKDF
jgi:hypothetical protein